MSKLQNTISIDIKSNGDGTYDTYISTESSGSHYEAITAQTIGEYTADLIDTLEESASGKSYLKAGTKTGHWIKEHECIDLTDSISKERDMFYCSECDAPNVDPTTYCPTCGKEMAEYKD